jgi:hypothetical protein
MFDRLTFEYVKNYFQEQDCTLLETEYVNLNHKMSYICICGETSKISFQNFKRGSRCGCRREGKGRSQRIKLTFEYVKNYFQEQNCTLLEIEFANCKTPLSYICECGKQAKTYFHNFKRGHRCGNCKGPKTNLSFEYVKNYFQEQNCTLLETEYVNSRNLLSYVCEHGNECKTRFQNFKNGRRCNCENKLTFEYVKNYFQEQNCTLLENEYISSSKQMSYICKCGNKSVTRFNNFKRGRRCRNCMGSENSKRSKLSFKTVKQYFQDKGCTLLETKYEKTTTPMSYICKCGNKGKASFDKFRQGYGCKECRSKTNPGKIRGRKKFTFEYVKHYFQEQGCTLLETQYHGMGTPMRYICSCGNQHEKTFNNFKFYKNKKCGIRPKFMMDL